MRFTKKTVIYTIALMIGAIAGYAYYYFIGCSSGSCSITSSPINSTIYGAVMAVLVIKLFPEKTISKTK